MSSGTMPMSARRLYILGTIQTTAPLHIGQGARTDPAHETDQPVLLDATGKPYIPGTTLAGVMRTVATQLVTALEGWDLKDVLELFGSVRAGRREEQQTPPLPSHPSKLRLRHARLKSDWRGWTEVRDGVGIDRQRSAARANIKFDYEILPPGLDLDFWLELRDGDEREKVLLAMVLTALEALPFSVGAKGSGGLGALKWQIERVVAIDLTNQDDLYNFLLQREEFIRRKAQEAGQDWGKWRDCVLQGQSFSVKNGASISRMPQAFVFTYELTLQEPVLIQGRAEPVTAFEALKRRKGEIQRAKEALDAIWVGIGSELDMSDWKPILPGPSLRGAFRSHCERILRTLSWHYTKEALQGKTIDHNAIYQEYRRRCAARVDPWEDNSELREKVDQVWERHMGQVRQEEEKWFEAGRDMAKVVWEGSDLAERLFGSTLWKSLVVVSEAYLKDGGWHEMLFDHLAIERFSGGALEHKKFDTLPVTKATFEGKVAVFGDELRALGLIVLLFKDLADGLVRIGSAKTRGYGKVMAKVTKVEAYLLPGSQLAKRLGLPLNQGKGKVWQCQSWELQGKFPESLPEDLKGLLKEGVNELNERVKNFRVSRPEGEG